jgi:hypothetical protein
VLTADFADTVMKNKRKVPLPARSYEPGGLRDDVLGYKDPYLAFTSNCTGRVSELTSGS